LTHNEIADELLALLTAGHETTATTLAWTVERLRRYPQILRRLVTEVDEGDWELRQATLREVQRVRPVSDAAVRKVRGESVRLGRRTLPPGQNVLARIRLLHENDELFPHASTFDPDRFLGVRVAFGWIPCGGGVRRCIGAAFATLEMDIVLRTLLRDFTLVTTTAPDEGAHFRGIALAPAKQGRAIVYRRTRGGTGIENC
jgi:cytochrome P450 family 138